MKKNEGKNTVTRMAALLGVSRSAYYKWKKRGFSDRQEKADAKLLEILREIHENHKYYGVLRVVKELREKYGMRVNRKRISRLLRKHGLNAKTRRKWVQTTDSNHGLPVCENILNREFAAKYPGQKWVSDLTYIWTVDGWRYLTVVIDLFDRKVIGWAFSADMTTEHTTIPALVMAFMNRKPRADLIFHSDRGVQYCARLFRDKLETLCPTVMQSMSRKGNCWDNACAESFFKTLKLEVEILDGKHTAVEVEAAVFYYIEVYYNRKRRHSAIDYKVPIEASCGKVA